MGGIALGAAAALFPLSLVHIILPSFTILPKTEPSLRSTIIDVRRLEAAFYAAPMFQQVMMLNDPLFVALQRRGLLTFLPATPAAVQAPAEPAAAPVDISIADTRTVQAIQVLEPHWDEYGRLRFTLRFLGRLPGDVGILDFEAFDGQGRSISSGELKNFRKTAADQLEPVKVDGAREHGLRKLVLKYR